MAAFSLGAPGSWSGTRSTPRLTACQELLFKRAIISRMVWPRDRTFRVLPETLHGVCSQYRDLRYNRALGVAQPKSQPSHHSLDLLQSRLHLRTGSKLGASLCPDKWLGVSSMRLCLRDPKRPAKHCFLLRGGRSRCQALSFPLVVLAPSPLQLLKVFLILHAPEASLACPPPSAVRGLPEAPCANHFLLVRPG